MSNKNPNNIFHQQLAAVSYTPPGPRLGGVKMGSAWVGAWHGAWVVVVFVMWVFFSAFITVRYSIYGFLFLG